MSNNSSGAQLGSIENNIIALKAKLASVQQAADTYDREYMDRTVDKPLNNMWRTRGITTLQDWVLFLFFVLYGILTLALIGLIIRNMPNPLMPVLMVLILSVSIGIMISAVIVRFA